MNKLIFALLIIALSACTSEPIKTSQVTYRPPMPVEQHARTTTSHQYRSLGNKRVFRVHPDCFIVNIVFAWEQAVAKTSANEIGMIASHRFPMFRPKNNQCNIDYLTYFFKTPRGIKWTPLSRQIFIEFKIESCIYYS